MVFQPKRENQVQVSKVHSTKLSKPSNKAFFFSFAADGETLTRTSFKSAEEESGEINEKCASEF